MIGLLDPKVVTIDSKEFTLSKFPAVAGREIIAKYPTSGMPKIGDYKVNEETMLKLMSYVAVKLGDHEQRLTTIDLVNNHVGNWETLAKIEIAMMEYNCSFFQNGRVSNFLNDAAQKAPAWISKILTDLSERSLQATRPPLNN